MKMVTVAQMREIERQADAAGLSYAQMMENAGRGLAETVLDLFAGPADGQGAFGLVGPGNNGGDTLVALERLAEQGWQARAYLVGRKPDDLVRRLQQAGGEVIQAEDDQKYSGLEAFLQTSDVVFDGLLGTGIKLPLKGEVKSVLRAVNQALAADDALPFLVAVDCPSGVDCDSGEAAGECLHADLTVTMAAVKQGLLRLPAFGYLGDLQVVEIGLPADLPAWEAVRTTVAGATAVAAWLPERPAQAHKGTFGTALIAAGSVSYTGAALLAGKAAYRAGAGLVTMAVPGSLHPALAGHFPEATWALLPHEGGVIARQATARLVKEFDRATALLLGPGFGLEPTTGEFLEDLLKGHAGHKAGGGRIGFLREDAREAVGDPTLPPLIVDADGLKLLARLPDWAGLLPGSTILTPHPGEMAVLTGATIEEIQADRLGVAAKFANDWGHVVVLKGAFTVISAPDGRQSVVPVASAALARAGTGDVLAGLIAGLRAQGLEAYEAAVAGAWIHARAGLLAADDLGGSAAVLAGDVLEAISDVMAELA